MSEVAVFGHFAHRSQGGRSTEGVRSGPVPAVAAASELIATAARGTSVHRSPFGTPRRRRRPGPAATRCDRPLPPRRRHRRHRAELDDERVGGFELGRTPHDDRDAASRRASTRRLELATFCSGTGRSWAERRTSIAGERGASIETVSLWIRIDPASGRPTGLGDTFIEVYGPAAGDRKVSRAAPARRSTRRCGASALADPAASTSTRSGHVNNAVHWAIVEETLPEGSRRGRAEIEYLAPIEPDTHARASSVDRRTSQLAARRRAGAHRRPMDACAVSTRATGVLCLQGGRELTPPCEEMDRTVLERSDGSVVVLAGAARPGSDYAGASKRTVAHYRTPRSDGHRRPRPARRTRRRRSTHSPTTSG